MMCQVLALRVFFVIRARFDHHTLYSLGPPRNVTEMLSVRVAGKSDADVAGKAAECFVWWCLCESTNM